MREIKFRAWDKKLKQLSIPVQISNPPTPGHERGLILMQFTGLKDKNGKEIYEGDVVRHGEGFGSTARLVKYLDGHFFPVGAESGCGCC